MRSAASALNRTSTSLVRVGSVSICQRGSMSQLNTTRCGGAYTSTLAQWRTFGYDTHSLISTATALFVNPAGNDYRLAAGSPAIDAGTNLSPDVVADIVGTTRPQRAAYDIGAYEMP